MIEGGGSKVYAVMRLNADSNYLILDIYPLSTDLKDEVQESAPVPDVQQG